MIFCDFETASALDIKKVGAFRYAEHCTTEVLCFCFAFDGIIYDWSPYYFPDRGNEYVEWQLYRLAEDNTVTFLSLIHI